MEKRAKLVLRIDEDYCIKDVKICMRATQAVDDVDKLPVVVFASERSFFADLESVEKDVEKVKKLDDEITYSVNAKVSTYRRYIEEIVRALTCLNYGVEFVSTEY